MPNPVIRLPLFLLSDLPRITFSFRYGTLYRKQMNNSDDLIETVESAQKGNARAFEHLMLRFQDRALAVALAQLGNYHQAEDAVQEAFVEVYLRIGQLQTPIAFPSWLNRIVLGKCVRALRTGKSVAPSVSLQSLIDTAAKESNPEATLLRKAATEVLRDALHTLSSQEREALLLFAVGGYRYEEIAQMMELSLQIIRRRIYTARRRLRNASELAALRLSPRQTESSQRTLRQRVAQQAAERLAQSGQHALKRQAISALVKEKHMSKITMQAMNVDLVGPGSEHRTVIKNLYTFYRYEMLLTNHYDDREDGQITPPTDANEDTWRHGAWVNRFGVIDGLDAGTHDEAVQGEDIFWKWPNLQAFLIRLNGWPAGFACVASPPNATRGVDYRLQEFFILNKARQSGVGSAAAKLLFDRLPGRWELAYTQTNLPAVAFWQKFIPTYTEGDFVEEMIGMGDSPDLPGYVFTRGLRPTHPIAVR